MAEHRTDDGVDWPAVLDELERTPSEQLGASDLVRLADALFWCDRLDDSIATRRQAYGRHVEADDDGAAAMTAWRIFYEHFLVGEGAPASGWLERCRSHATASTDPVVLAWMRLAEGDVAARNGMLDEAIATAATVIDTGRRHRSADLTAMGLQLEGRVRVEHGDRFAGFALLDEAMVAVVNDELAPLFTGWVYCNVIATCYHAADLRRASEWSDAAERWCATLRDGRLYRGLCRVYAAELATLGGDWLRAQSQVELACDELTTHDSRYAGAAYYLAGELRRRRGDRAGADAAFERARELGHPTQPGHAMALAEAGRVDDAIGSLRTALRPAPTDPLPHAQLLTALIAIAADRLPIDDLAAAVDSLTALAERHDAPILDALAELATARRALARDDLTEATVDGRRAIARLDDLGCPYDAAEARLVVAEAARRDGDAETARHELRAAVASFERLGAGPRAAAAARRLSDLDGGDERSVPSPLSAREVEVLGLVARGMTNREIAADLHLSPHTVARHVSNIRTKLGASSRTAAVTRGVELGIV